MLNGLGVDDHTRRLQELVLMVCVVLVKEFCHRDRGFGKQKLLQVDYSYAKRCGRYVILKVFDQFLQDGWTLLF
jgi:hypothetical protein